MSAHPLTIPDEFAKAFFHIANHVGPPPRDNKPATNWFEDRMLELAQAAAPPLYCQNHRQSPPGEWMKIDHVFVEDNRYDCFPLIAVEHENGNVSPNVRLGALPPGTDRKAHIEWAMWKVLAMQAHLRVLVCYPWHNDKNDVLARLAEMTAAHKRSYQKMPNVLLLLGWWFRPAPRDSNVWRAEDLYKAYIPDQRGIGFVEIEP